MADRGPALAAGSARLANCPCVATPIAPFDQIPRPASDKRAVCRPSYLLRGTGEARVTDHEPTSVVTQPDGMPDLCQIDRQDVCP